MTTRINLQKKSPLSCITFHGLIKMLQLNGIYVDLNNGKIENIITGEVHTMLEYKYVPKTEIQKKYANVLKRQFKVRRNIMRLIEEEAIPSFNALSTSNTLN